MDVIIPIPNNDFDPTEVSIPWLFLTSKGVNVVFATPNGEVGKADQRMIYGSGLGFFKNILVARNDAINAYKKLLTDDNFNSPLKYDDIDVKRFDGIILPGGHAQGMKPYLESKILQYKVKQFFDYDKPVGAICHGTIVLARTIDSETGLSVIANYQTTSLLKTQELFAYYLTKHRLKNYYRTYHQTVEDEVKNALVERNNFKKGNIGLFRDSFRHLGRGFYVKDKNYISARWPGDAYIFSIEFYGMLKETNRTSHY